MDKLFCDVLIIGAGIIGASLALCLAQSGIKVIIIDRQRLISDINQIAPNIRVSAINYRSVNFFKKINIWDNIPKTFITPYYYMKTWECPSSMVTFSANSIGISKMGCIVENDKLKLALWKNMLNSKLIRFYHSSTFFSLKYDGVYWKCVLNTNIKIQTKLLIGSDGSNSKIRNYMKIDIVTWKHYQSCMLMTIKTEKNTNGTIWQNFTPNGPISFLPLYDNWGSLMWFDTPSCIDKLSSLPKSVLEEKISNKFCEELGQVIVYKTCVIPIKNQRACKYIGKNSILIGDAAHSIHPLAGQGINLGIRDVITLSELLVNPDIFNIDPFILKTILSVYQDHRQHDVHIMQSSINWLYFIFHNNFLPLKMIRNLTFMTIENIPYIKRQLLKYAALGI